MSAKATRSNSNNQFLDTTVEQSMPLLQGQMLYPCLLVVVDLVMPINHYSILAMVKASPSWLLQEMTSYNYVISVASTTSSDSKSAFPITVLGLILQLQEVVFILQFPIIPMVHKADLYGLSASGRAVRFVKVL